MWIKSIFATVLAMTMFASTAYGDEIVFREMNKGSGFQAAGLILYCDQVGGKLLIENDGETHSEKVYICLK